MPSPLPFAMLEKLLKIFLYSLLFILISYHSSYAYNPASVSNNRYGVHILDPNEIIEASKLVNSSGGDWGYVTIPLRINDRDPEKWTKFFDSARRLHIIPIIRLATYPHVGNWVRPTVYDLVDFANFLNDMPWPTQNRYIILFNEPNHSYEWDGRVNPPDYVNLLIDSRRIFKSRSDNFFLLTAGLDMSAPNSKTSIDALDFYRLMTKFKPDWYSHIDGLAVHAYPNPGFSSSPFSTSRYGITSFRYETSLLSSLGFPPKPIFITETGTTSSSDFYIPAFTQIWTDPQIAAITPFLLYSASGDFAKFSLLNPILQPKNSYTAIYQLPKISGSPLLANITLTPAKSTFSSPKLSIGKVTISVELANTDFKRQRGLSSRSTLGKDSGMLFIFPQAGKYAFWMQDMRFPLDFIWIKDNRVVQITHNVFPPSKTHGQPSIVSPRMEVDQVLEVNAGFVRDHAIKIGDPVVLNYN